MRQDRTQMYVCVEMSCDYCGKGATVVNFFVPAKPGRLYWQAGLCKKCLALATAILATHERSNP